MNVLVIGSGGREHALAWKIAQSDKVNNLYIAPGNAGTCSVGENVNIDISDFQSIKTVVLKNNINLVVVGPEQPLVDGIVDYFKQDNELKNVKIIGPDKRGAMLEGSKAFAKQFMENILSLQHLVLPSLLIILKKVFDILILKSHLSF